MRGALSPEKGQNMIGTLARKRTNVAALAVLVALVVAMFAVLPNVSAVDNTNDRTAIGFGACVLDTGEGQTNYMLVGDSCTITTADTDVVNTSDSTIVAGGTAESGTFTLTALAVGSVTITDTGEATGLSAVADETINIEVLAAPTVTITFDDSDATVKAGANVVATVTTRGFSGNHAVTISVPSTGLVITGVGTSASPGGGTFAALVTGVTSTQIVVSESTRDGTSGLLTAAAGWPASAGTPESLDGLSATVTIRTTGAPEGEYPVSASVESVDVDADTAGEGNTPPTDILIQKASTTAKLTVGEAGAGLSSATLSLGMRTATAEETGTDKAGGDGIKLDIESFNSLGAKANGRDINTIIVSAIGSNNIAIGGLSSAQGALTVTEASASTDTVKQKHTVVVSKSTPGTVDVTATVIGASGVATTETITLTFSGNPETHAVAAPADALAQENDVFQPAVKAVAANADATPPVVGVEAKDAVEGGLKFEVTGSDEAGNQSALTTAQITARVLDADDKNVSSKFSITEDIKENTNGVVVIRVGTGSEKLDAGTYTLETKLTGKDTQETEFAVSGGAADVALAVSVNPDPLELGSLIDVTATVTDANGTAVADGTLVDFATGGSLTLDEVGSIVNVKTDDGVAKARFIVSKGDGLATIIADAGTATGVTTVSLAAAGAMADEEASVACLSNLNGFATWSCGVESSASEIFGLVSGRGATAIHLWNGSAWVRYSVVDGTMVPGSSDFMVAENDILYISN